MPAYLARPEPTRELPATGYLVALALEAVVAIAAVVVTPGQEPLPLGEVAGWTGLGSMLAMQLYSLRRRIRALSRIGALRPWLDWHIFMGVQGGILVTYHGSRLDHWRSASGVGLGLMWLVLCSGLFGRYLFSRVPRKVTGDVLAARELDHELLVVGAALAARLDTPDLLVMPELPRTATLGETRAHARDLRARLARLLAAVAGQPDAAALTALAKRRVRLALRRPRMVAAERALRTWLLLHRPITIALGTVAMLHVISHFAFRAVP